MEIAAGLELSHYRLIRKVGEGGMGVVWEAEDTRLRRRVALKLVPEPHASDAEGVDRHLREARAASSINHPNICSVHDVGEWRGRKFIVLELLRGRTLAEEIDGRPMAVGLALDLALQIAEALAAAHAKGILHRDVKSANLFVVRDGSARPRAKILDFGLARLSDPGPAGSDAETMSASSRTAEGSVLGTLPYMSPEQALGKPLDARTDLFSLGAVLYEMLTGRRAFDGVTAAEISGAVLHVDPPPIRETHPDVPQELERLVFRALAKDPDERHASADELAADLRRIRDQRSTGSHATPGQDRDRSRARWAIPLVAAAALAAVGFFALRRGEPPAPGPAGERPARGAATIAEAAGGTPSIAVLPFVNASGDPAQDYFGDGLTEEIINELSRYRELAVIARHSTRRYRNVDEDLRAIGEALGSRYVLRGSVRRAGDRIRLGVELASTADARTIWSEIYDRDLTASDLFELQDELTQRVVNSIAGVSGALTREGLPDARRRAPANLDSYDCVLRVYEYLQVHVGENHAPARECLDRVVAAEPGYAEGRAWLAYLLAEQYHHRWDPEEQGPELLDRALASADTAVRLDPTSHVGHGVLALTLFFHKEHEAGVREAIRTVELNPNNALWLALLGTYLARQGDFERSEAMTRRAIELNPHPPDWVGMALFYSAYHDGRYGEALELATTWGTNDYQDTLYRLAALGQLGRSDAAERELGRFREAWERPLSDLRSELVDRNAVLAEIADHLLDGARKAGLEVDA